MAAFTRYNAVIEEIKRIDRLPGSMKAILQLLMVRQL